MLHLKDVKKESWIITAMIASALPFLSLLARTDYSLIGTDTRMFTNLFLSDLANILGFLGALIFFWQILIGTRHFTSHVTPNTIWTNKLHRALGTYGIIFVLAHPLLEAYAYLKSIPWLFAFSFHTETETFISIGRIALILFLIIWITSAILRSKIKFHPWRYIHYLSYPLMAFIFIHALSIGTFLQTVPWIKLYWMILLGMYLFILLARIAIGGGLWKKSYLVSNIEHIGDSIIILRLSPISARIVEPRIGQYAYLQVSRFHQAHPFTVMDVNASTGELIFGIRTGGAFTHQLSELPIGTELLVDGPYGVFTAEAQNTQQKIVIAGGIGITPFIRLAKHYGKGMTLIYCNRTPSDLVYHNDLASSTEKYVDIIEQPSGFQSPNLREGRISIETLKDIVGPQALTHLPYFVCGSPAFIDIMKQMLINGGIPKHLIHAEELGY